MIPDCKTAKDLFEEIIVTRNNSASPFTAEQEQTFRAHCSAVADIAQTIAAHCGLDRNKAWVIGLLHDCGRIKDEPNENVFHGLVGWHYMQKKGFPELARYSLTHTFYDKDFNMDNYPQNKNDLMTCKKLLENIEYDDYDRLLQLADLCNNMGKSCTLEYRMESISKRYKIPYLNVLSVFKTANRIKAYFDAKCGQDIYRLLGIKNETTIPGHKNGSKNMAGRD